MLSRSATYLIHNVNKGLGVLPRKATNHVIHILAHEDLIDERREFMRDKLACNQAFKGWSFDQSAFHTPRSIKVRSNPTSRLGYRGCGGPARMNKLRLSGAFKHAIGSAKGWAWPIKSIEYILNL